VVARGTGRRADPGDRVVGGKTGTSQGWRDAWFVGYSHDLVVGVWTGNDDNAPMAEVTGGRLPAELFAEVMRAAPPPRAPAPAAPPAPQVAGREPAARDDGLERAVDEGRAFVERVWSWLVDNAAPPDVRDQRD
jgi:penicillin-binding protein 1A